MCPGILTFVFFVASIAVNIGLQVLFLSLTITFFLIAVGEDEHPRVLKVGPSMHKRLGTLVHALIYLADLV